MPVTTTTTQAPAPASAPPPVPPYWQALSAATAPRSFSIITRDGALATTDGGATWLRLGATEPFDAVWNVAAPAPGELFAVQQWADDGSSAQIVRSDDGGRTWKHVAYAGIVYHAGDYADLGFSDPRNGWIVTAEPVGNGDATVFRTFDGGHTWTTELRSGYPEWDASGLPGDAHAEFLGADLGFAVGTSAGSTGSSVSAVLTRTIDGGRHWTTVVTTMIADLWNTCFTIGQCAVGLPYFSTATTAYTAVIAKMPGFADRWHVAVLRSTDSGLRWNVRARLDVDAASPPQVLFVDFRHWVVLNADQVTADGGLHWHAEWSPDASWPALAMNGRVYAIDTHNQLWVRKTNGVWVDVAPGALPPR